MGDALMMSVMTSKGGWSGRGGREPRLVLNPCYLMMSVTVSQRY